MNWEAIGAIGELLGAIVVVITILFLGRQIRLGTNQQRMESHRAMAELQIQTNRILYDPEISRSIINALQDWNSVDFDSRNVTRQWITDTITHYQALFKMWEGGAVEDQAYKAEEDFLVLELLATNGGKAYWQENALMFNQQFVQRIEPLIANKPLGMYRKAYEDLQREKGDA